MSQKTPPAIRKTYKYNATDWTTLKEDIDAGTKIVTDKFEQGDDVEELWTTFKTKLQDAIDKNIPTTQQQRRTSLPWLDYNIKKMLKRKQRLLNKARQTNNWTQYRQYQKHCRRTCRQAEWEYVNKKINEGLQNNTTRPFWSWIKAKKQENIGVAPLREGNTLHTDSKNKARLLLQQFKSVFTTQTTNTLPQLPPTAHPTISQINITTAGIAKLLHDLNPYKATGPDNIPNRILKDCADQIAPALTAVYQ